MTDIPLSAISASSLGGDAQSAQNIDLVIVGFNHDTLSSDGTTKAVLTLGQKDCLSTAGSMYTYADTYEYARYSTSVRRTWLNSDYYNALPSDLKSLIKPVQKLSGYPISSSNYQFAETTSETCWFASNWEVFGQNYSGYTSVTDGTQYPYYSIASNRSKLGGYGVWWTRSGFWNSSTNRARFVGGRVTADDVFANTTINLAPHFCL